MKTRYWIVSALLVLVFFVAFSCSGYNPRISVSEYFFQKGSYYFNGGEFDTDKAEKFFQWSLYFDPKKPYAHYQLARIYFIWNNASAARKEIDEELRLHPENKRSYYVRGLINGYAKDYGESARDFEKFIENFPEEWAGYMDLSWVYINSKKFEEAADAAGRGLEMSPDNVWLMSNKGLALYKLGRYQEAIDMLERSKVFVEKLKEDEWKETYPGNDPKGAKDGIMDLKGAISYNLALAYRKKGEFKKFSEETMHYQSLFLPGDPRGKKIEETLKF